MKLLLGLFLTLWSYSATAGDIHVLTVADTINPGTGDYIVSGIREAEKADAPAVILVLDTPGGLLSTTR